jgi:hypothetical protein
MGALLVLTCNTLGVSLRQFNNKGANTCWVVEGAKKIITDGIRLVTGHYGTDG